MWDDIEENPLMKSGVDRFTKLGFEQLPIQQRSPKTLYERFRKTNEKFVYLGAWQ